MPRRAGRAGCERVANGENLVESGQVPVYPYIDLIFAGATVAVMMKAQIHSGNGRQRYDRRRGWMTFFLSIVPKGLGQTNLRSRIRLSRAWSLGIICFVLSTNILQADDFRIRIQVNGKSAEPSPPEKSPHRPAVRVNHNQPVLVNWEATNQNDSINFKNVLVHFYVIKQASPDSPVPSKLGNQAVYEGAITADFESGEKASWKFELNLPEIGVYLLRIETLGLKSMRAGEVSSELNLITE